MTESNTQIDRNLLLHMLKEAVITVNFTKKNGEPRKMVCTLRDDYLPSVAEADLTEDRQRKAVNEETVCVWDVDVKSWRSFRLDSIIDINGTKY